MKCRVTCNGSRIKMQDCETSNVDWKEVRLLFHMAASHPAYKGSVQTADAEQGYLQTEAKEGPVYMIPPELHPDRAKDIVWKLDKNLYGLPNGGAVFEEKVRNTLLDAGWIPIDGTKHCWRKEHINKNGSRLLLGYLGVFVDDFLAIGVHRSATEL